MLFVFMANNLLGNTFKKFLSPTLYVNYRSISFTTGAHSLRLPPTISSVFPSEYFLD